MALTFSGAARDAQVRRIIYLGGMIPADPGRYLSPHLRSRATVGEILRASSVPTIELRAAVIIGSGSASFEMLRYLTERLPAMITPLWVRTKTNRSPSATCCTTWSRPPRCQATSASLRHRRSGCHDLPIDDAGVRVGRRTAQADHPADQPAVTSPVQPLGRAGDPGTQGIARPLVESLKVPVVCRDHSIAAVIPIRPKACCPIAPRWAWH